MKNRMMKVFGLLLIVAILAACAPATKAPATSAPATNAPATSAPAVVQKPYANELYIYVSAMGNLEYFNAHKYGWKWAGEALGVKAEYVGPAEIDANAEAAA